MGREKTWRLVATVVVLAVVASIGSMANTRRAATSELIKPRLISSTDQKMTAPVSKLSASPPNEPCDSG